LGRQDVLILVLLFDTAIRVEELVKLKQRNVILYVTEPYILIEGKGNKERTVTLNSKTVALLKDYIEEFHKDNASGVPLFYTVIKGEKGRMSTRNVERLVRNMPVCSVTRFPGCLNRYIPTCCEIPTFEKSKLPVGWPVKKFEFCFSPFLCKKELAGLK